MKLFFLTNSLSNLCDPDTHILEQTKNRLLDKKPVEEVLSPASADAIIFQEKNSFKDFRYIKELKADDIISKYPHKVFTINRDDCATGLLKGLYTSMPASRFDVQDYRAVPYMEYPNEFVFKKDIPEVSKTLLASWRGNLVSNPIRPKLLKCYQGHDQFCLESTESWLDHGALEKKEYVDLIRRSHFSLCPAGWAPNSFRIYESMALGVCPVIIADLFVPPKGPDWNEFALFFPEKDLNNLHSFLEKNTGRAKELGARAKDAWQKYFSKEFIGTYYANSLLEIINSASGYSRRREMKKWNSFKFHWRNNWTIPQRTIRKIDRVKSSILRRTQEIF